MKSSETKTVTIAEDVKVRLQALAGRDGHSVDEMADMVLRSYVDAEERAAIDRAEDDRRWQKYKDSGETIPVEAFRKKLHALAAQAAAKQEM